MWELVFLGGCRVFLSFVFGGFVGFVGIFFLWLVFVFLFFLLGNTCSFFLFVAKANIVAHSCIVGSLLIPQDSDFGDCSLAGLQIF